MTKKIPPTVSEYMASIGRKGGKNGKGKPKTRKVVTKKAKKA
jgi:hypothetical protein